MLKSIKLGLILFIITSMAGLILGVAHEATKDAIAKQSEQSQKQENKVEILKGVTEYKDSSIEIPADSGIKKVSEGYEKDKLIGYAITLETKGFGGKIEMKVGISKDGTVQGIDIVKHQETPGLGANAEKEEFRSQYKDKSTDNTLEVIKGSASKDNEISAITGATVTSKAVTDGVNTAANFYKNNLKGGNK
ncbi:RnfABCDGE type electron transport complex subunit G [Haloimpatiens sp. FM7330]|uniref:RnfABCDGE type electron transport complex subunit G n=1 Tax=Haloimpatiens sp. FM7330 TaxID=3298610 RepID=UPI00363E78C4